MAIWQSHVPLDRNTNNSQGQDRGHSAHRFNSLLLNTRLKHGLCIINLQHIKFCSSISSVTISKMGGEGGNQYFVGILNDFVILYISWPAVFKLTFHVICMSYETYGTRVDAGGYP